MSQIKFRRNIKTTLAGTQEIFLDRKNNLRHVIRILNESIACHWIKRGSPKMRPFRLGTQSLKLRMRHSDVHIVSEGVFLWVSQVEEDGKVFSATDIICSGGKNSLISLDLILFNGGSISVKLKKRSYGFVKGILKHCTGFKNGHSYSRE